MGGIRYFDEWVPLAYRCSDQEMIELANAASYEEIAVLDNQRVTVFDYKAPKSVPLVKLPELYDDLNPLYDPYLKALPKLFTGSLDGKEVSLGYIRSDDSPSQIKKRLEQSNTFNGNNGEEAFIHVVGSNKEQQFLLFPFLLLLIFLRVPEKKALKILVYMVFSLPVFLFSFSGLSGAVPALFLFPFFWRNILDRIWDYHTERFLRDLPAERERRRLKVHLTRYALFSIFSLLFLGFFSGNWKSLPYLGLVLLNPYSVVISAWALGLIGRYTRQHRKFIPLQLLPKGRWKLLSLSYLSLFISSLLFLLFTLPGEKDIALTVPLPSEETRWTLLTNQGIDERERALPGGGDYLAHRAFHEGYLYGMEYRIPSLGEEIILERYSSIDGELYREKVTAKQFTEQWYEDIMAPQKRGGIESLLLNGGRPIALRYSAVQEDPDHNRTLPNQILLILWVLFLFVFAEAEPRSPLFTKVASIRITRSKEQAA